MIRTISKIFLQLGYLIAGIIVVAALFVSIGRLLTPILNDHLPNFEKLASDHLQVPVKIGHVHIGWDVYEPTINIENIAIINPKNQESAFNIKLIVVNLNLLDSLFHAKTVLQSVHLSGAHLTIQQPTSNQILIEEFKDFPFDDDKKNLDETLKSIFAITTVEVSDIDIDYRLPSGKIKSFTLPRLTLRNYDNHHQLVGDLILLQKLPVRARINISWEGDLQDRKTLSADGYLSIEGIDVAQWLTPFSWHDLHLNQGIGSAKVWATWKDNQFEKIQSQFQFYDLEIASKQKSQLIQRISGHVGWKRDGQNFIFAGEDVLINLPDHLWPANDFSLTLNNNLDVQALHFTYVDLAETQKLAAHFDLIPEDIEKTFAKWNPSGEIQDLVLVIPEATRADTSTWKTNGKFKNLNFQAVENFPGTTHLSGAFNWNGRTGNLNFDSAQSTITLSQVFKAPLFFEQLTGNITAEKTENNGWKFATKKLHTQNNDLSADTDLTLTLPQNESPEMHLSADFTLNQASNISHYLPLQIFEPQLVDWLEHAFLGGQADSGHAIFDGRLKDFPFKNNEGKFLITGKVKNAELLYAPEWPSIQNIEGTLVFSNNSMTVDITGGKILNIPITFAHANIPALSGTEPQILTVQGAMTGDLSQGADFIYQSPLKTTIGKNLSKLEMKGPMQLNLGLNVPLEKPKETTVLGKATVNNATINLPLWNLSLEKVQGAFQFTEKDFEASQLKGSLLNEPFTLDITTPAVTNQPKYIQAQLKSVLSVTHLEEWLKIPLAQYATGNTNFQVTLKLPADTQSNNTEVTLLSDLKGIALNLPVPYNKTTEQTSDFKLLITTPSGNRPILSRIYYNKLLSAALAFQNSGKGLKFFGGELRIGEGEANAPTQPGLMVIAQFKTLDLTTFDPYLKWYKAQPHTDKNSLNDSVFRGLDIEANAINLYGQTLNKAHVILTKANSLWNIAVHSNEAEGQISFPNDISNVQANFQRFYFTSSDNKTSTSFDPKSIPTMSINIGDTRYGNKQLGNVILQTIPANGGMQIQQLQVKSDVGNINATGSWVGQRSRIQGTLDTQQATKMLTHWGMNASALVATQGNATFDLNWIGAPFDPSLGDLNGTLSFKLAGGRIINLGNSTEAKLGLGRLLNLLSFQSLPRRLSLDFSDIFQSGYSFDVMKGDYRLQNGNAFTENMLIDGPVATVGIAGRIGLKAKDYDLKLGVSAHVTSSLPMVAAVAFNPVVGVAAWAVDTIASTQVSKITTYDYRIVGTWDNPVWTKIGNSPKKTGY